jgi:hypothetical protein
MMQRTVTPGTAAVSLKGQLGINRRTCESVILQGHIDNSGVIYWGDVAGQEAALEAKDTIRIESNFEEIYVKGSSANEKVVVVLER